MENIIWYQNPEWWSAIGTIFVGLVAVLIAIFQEKIVKYFRTTCLQGDLNLAPPDCHKIKIRDQFGTENYCYYSRIRITNVGEYPAENVEVMVNKCWEITEGKKKERKIFLPMNLKWSHYGVIDMSRILSGHFRHCDIGSFRFTLDNKVILVFDTATQPNQVEGDKYPNILESGSYQIELIIGANNVKTFTQIYEISFNDDFYMTENDMFSKNISINKIIDLLLNSNPN